MVIEGTIVSAAKEGISGFLAGSEIGAFSPERLAIESLADKFSRALDGGLSHSTQGLELNHPVEESVEENAISNLRDKFEFHSQIDATEVAGIHQEVNPVSQGPEQIWGRYYMGDSDGKHMFSLVSGRDVDALNGGLPPNSLLEVQSQTGNLITSEVDALGRISEFRIDHIESIDGTRDKAQQGLCCELKDGLPSDDAGHILAREFGGPSEQFNLVPMDAHVNRHGEWRLMEHDWKDAIGNGKGISDVCVRMDYNDTCKRPTGFEVYYKMDGEIYSTYIDNSPKHSLS